MATQNNSFYNPMYDPSDPNRRNQLANFAALSKAGIYVPAYMLGSALADAINQRRTDKKDRLAMQDALGQNMPTAQEANGSNVVQAMINKPTAIAGDAPAFDSTPVTVTGADGKAYTYTPGEWNPVSFGNIAQRATNPAIVTQAVEPAIAPVSDVTSRPFDGVDEVENSMTPITAGAPTLDYTAPADSAAAPMMEYGAPVEQIAPGYNAAVDTEGYTPSAPTQEQHKTPAQLAQEQLDAAGMNPTMPVPQGASAYGRASLGQLMGNAQQTAPTQGGAPLVAMQDSLNASNAFNQLAEEAKKKELMEQMRGLKAFRGI